MGADPTKLTGLYEKVVLVTGGSRGIGRSIVEALSRAGCRTLFTWTAGEAAALDLESGLRQEGLHVRALKADVRAPSEMDGIALMIEQEYGRIDALINNAGIIRDNLIASMDPADWEAVIDTNLSGVFHSTQPVVRMMMRQRSGNIINLSSIAAQRPGRGHANYAAAKAGIEAMTRALAVELAPRAVRVNCVAPGMIETDMSKEIRNVAGDQILQRIPMKRYGTPADVANTVMFLLSDQSSYITGAVIPVDGGAACG